MSELDFLIQQYRVERDLLDSAEDFEAKLCWYKKWAATSYRLYTLLIAQRSAGRVH